MKSLYGGIGLCFLFFCVSCQQSSGLVGKWEAVPEQGSNPDDKVTFEFKVDNRYSMNATMHGSVLKMEGEYRVTGDQLTLLSAGISGSIGENTKINRKEEKVDQKELTVVTFKVIDSDTVEFIDSNQKKSTLKKVK